jgi:hypothetical protein
VYWEEQLAAYPDAKVVVTMRDPEKWYKSWMDTVAKTQPDCELCPFGIRVIAGLGIHPSSPLMFNNVVTRDCFQNDWSKENMIKCYLGHIEKCKLLCPPEKLLLFYATDGWEPLCKFLNVPVPDAPYPHENDTEVVKTIVFRANILGWILTILGLGIPALFRIQSSLTEDSKKSTNIGERHQISREKED